MRKSLYELKNEDNSWASIAGFGDIALGVGKLASSLGGSVVVDSAVKTVLNAAGVRFKPSRICARIFGYTVAKPMVKKAVEEQFKDYKESYVKFQKELMINIEPKKEETEDSEDINEEKEDGAEVQ